MEFGKKMKVFRTCEKQLMKSMKFQPELKRSFVYQIEMTLLKKVILNWSVWDFIDFQKITPMVYH